MAKFETTSRRKKIYKPNHTESGAFRMDYILLPMGYAYNTEYLEAKKGDIIRLFNGGEYEIYAIRRLKINKAETDILCRMRYGISIKGALSRWKMNAKLEGHSAKAVSTEECLWVIYEERADEQEGNI